MEPIPRRGPGPAPMSFAQQRLWLIDRMEHGDTAYSVLIPTRLRGPLDRDALAGALAAVVARHEVLRTSYAATDGEPVQIVHPPAAVPLPYTDLAGLPDDDRRSAVHQAVREEETHRFDLAAGSPIRARLLRLRPDDHVLLIGVHHIAVDVPSIHLLYDELAAGYNRRLSGAPGGTATEATGPPVQYADYAAWERNRLSGAERDRLLAYWRDRLDGLPPLDLPTDRPAPDVASGRGGFADLDLPEPVIAGVERLAAARGASVFDVLVAALSVVLSGYTGQDDFAVGTVVHRRPHPALESLIGFFANTLVLRLDTSGAPAFGELVDRVAGTTRAARQHGEVPFDLVVQDLAPRREAGRNPLFRVYFGLDETPEVLPDFTGLDAVGLLPDFTTTKFDLGFKVRTRPHDSSGPKLFSIYSLDLYDDDTIARMLGHLRTVLTSGVADPDRPITELPLLTPAERDAVFAWNDTERPFPADRRLHELFETRALARPDAPALACGTDALDYAELDRRANDLAHRLRAYGIGRDDVVGILLNRSIGWVVATLAVLKAGAAFLPIDPDYPAERVASMLGDAALVVTEAGLRDRTGKAVPVLCLDQPEVGARPGTAPRTPAAGPPEVPGGHPDDLAYVIYTSGSTGEPKGIELAHRGVVNNFCDFIDSFGIGPHDRVLAVSSPSFDMSVFDLLGVLAAGGTVVVPEQGSARDPDAWLRLIHRHRVNVWHSAPALLELLLERHARGGSGEPPLPLRLALLGGDWVALTLPDRLRAAAPGVRVVVLGGATEASMDSTVFEVGEVDPEWTSIPYGRPMANQRAYVLDRAGRPQPVGVPGELHLAGVGLARGYRGRPDLTARRFVERILDDGTPHGRRERLYRTGDLVRYRRDGVLELLGRMDLQVKVHGLRIEIGEIEAELRRDPGVAEAVAVARGPRGDTTLAAFVRPAGDGPLDVTALRRRLLTRLPAFMVPAAIVPVETFPTSRNGKVDRKALSERSPGGGSAATAPRDPVEERVAGVWRDVLGIDRFGIDDDFFTLGGDSFAAVRTMLALEEPVPVVELFKNPTVRTLAARIRASGQARGLLHRLTPAGRNAELTLVCLPYGGGNAVNYRQLALALPARFALWAAALPGHDPGTRTDPFLPIGAAAVRLAEEVERGVEGPVVVYGHCAGAATGVLLARELIARGRPPQAIYLAGALPDLDPAASLRRADQMTDREYADHLAGIGGFSGALDSLEVEIIMRAGRHDMIEATRFYLRGPAGAEPVDVPAHCVIGDADPTTTGFATRYRDWEAYVSGLDLSVISGGDHYFIRDRAEELAALIDRQLDDVDTWVR